MQKTYHILNGDALLSHLPDGIDGELLVARFCMVDGPVLGDTVTAIIKTRADFMQLAYKVNPQVYADYAIALCSKIEHMPSESKVYLWFEEDLFCQVNWWYCMFLLEQYTSHLNLFFVLPMPEYRYSFGAMSKQQLLDAYKAAKPITNKDTFIINALWRAYQHNNFTKLQELGAQLEVNYPFVIKAVQAHLERQERPNYLGKPKETLVSIIQDLNTEQFGPIFYEFCKRLPYYGFGDLQVKRLYNQLLDAKA